MNTIYIALLRGINVGGKNKIRMVDLKLALEELGLSGVQTYIQSGNVLFWSIEEEELLRARIERQIETVFGFSIPIILRTAEELDEMILKCPFTEEEIIKAEELSEVESLYVALLDKKPLQANIEQLKDYKSDGDKYHIEGREVYLLCNNSIRNSRIANNLHRLEVSITVRNWKTINKLSGLAKAMKI